MVPQDSVVKLVAIVSQEQDKALRVADIDPVDQLRHVSGEGWASLHFLPVDVKQVNYLLVDKFF